MNRYALLAMLVAISACSGKKASHKAPAQSEAKANTVESEAYWCGFTAQQMSRVMRQDAFGVTAFERAGDSVMRLGQVYWSEESGAALLHADRELLMQVQQVVSESVSANDYLVPRSLRERFSSLGTPRFQIKLQALHSSYYEVYPCSDLGIDIASTVEVNDLEASILRAQAEDKTLSSRSRFLPEKGAIAIPFAEKSSELSDGQFCAFEDQVDRHEAHVLTIQGNRAWIGVSRAHRQLGEVNYAPVLTRSADLDVRWELSGLQRQADGHYEGAIARRFRDANSSAKGYLNKFVDAHGNVFVYAPAAGNENKLFGSCFYSANKSDEYALGLESFLLQSREYAAP